MKLSCLGRIKMCGLPAAFSCHYTMVLAALLLKGSMHISVTKLFAGIKHSAV